jgi:hypothetical protein
VIRTIRLSLLWMGVAASTMLAAQQSAISAALMQGEKPLRVLDKGDQSNMDAGRQAVLRFDAEWQALWRLHAPDRPQPSVDFGREMVAAVFLGTRPTAGFSVEILDWREEAGALVVRYRETRPAKGLLTAQIITSAYAIVALPRREGAVRFERAD